MPDGIEEVGGRMPQGFNMEMYKFGVVDGRMGERADWRKSGERYVGVSTFAFVADLNLLSPVLVSSYSARIS